MMDDKKTKWEPFPTIKLPISSQEPFFKDDEEIILDIDFEPFGINRAAKLITKKEED